MNNINNKYNPWFSHIYIEKSVIENERTKRIIGKLPKARIIVIDNYMDVYGRYGQNQRKQSISPALILAERKAEYLYKGAPVCQSFGNENFYYTSGMIGCLYDCEYCYLKGKYHSGNIVIFVNLEDTFREVEKLLEKNSLYLCVSYDTDLMAIESITGFVNDWINFVDYINRNRKHDLQIEIRTKCGRTDLWKNWTPNDKVIFAYTISPQNVIEKYEHRTASLSKRIQAAKQAIEKGFSVRLCFDPMIYVKDWQKEYDLMWKKIVEEIEIQKIRDFSIGSFRISSEYMKTMRQVMHDSAVVQFPFINRDGVYQYPEDIRQEMEKFMVNRILESIDKDKIFLWKDSVKNMKSICNSAKDAD